MTGEAARRTVIVSVDGPAASGKGALARRIATHFNYAYLDTGLLYRAVGVALRRAGKGATDVRAAVAAARQLSPDLLDDPDLRNDDAASAASEVAAIPAVRVALRQFQRSFATDPPDAKEGAVLDGRDIGTVICPDATYKIFVDASVETRATRRVKELRERGVEAIYARVLQDMGERDARDRSRSVAPLAPADDAFLLDTTTLDANAAFVAALEFITSRNKSDA